MRRLSLLLLTMSLLTTMLVGVTPASAHDPEEDHTGPGSSGPDQHTQNVKLLASVW